MFTEKELYILNWIKEVSKVREELNGFALLKNDIPSFERYFGTWQNSSQYNNVQPIDWQREVYGRLGEVVSQDLSVRGGSDKMNFNFNYARYDEKAIMIGSDFLRNNLSLSLKNKVSKKIDLSYTLRYSDTQINGGGANEQKEVSSADSRLRHVVGYSPIAIPELTTDDTDEAISGYLTNPFVAVQDNNRRQLRKNFNMQTSFGWKIIENLQFKSDIGLDNYNYFWLSINLVAQPQPRNQFLYRNQLLAQRLMNLSPC